MATTSIIVNPDCRSGCSMMGFLLIGRGWRVTGFPRIMQFPDNSHARPISRQGMAIVLGVLSAREDDAVGTEWRDQFTGAIRHAFKPGGEVVGVFDQSA